MRAFSIKLYSLLFLIFSIFASASETIDHRIAVLVNDEIITTFDIVQRMKINAIINGINITSENRQILSNSVVDDLIDEKLKYEKSMEYEIKVNDEEYRSYEQIFFERLPYSKLTIIENLKNNNIKYLEFKNYLIGEIAWNKLISRLYYRISSASEIEIIELISKNPNLDENQAEEIVIQRQLDLNSSKLLRDMRNEATIEFK